MWGSKLQIIQIQWSRPRSQRSVRVFPPVSTHTLVILQMPADYFLFHPSVRKLSLTEWLHISCQRIDLWKKGKKDHWKCSTAKLLKKVLKAHFQFDALMNQNPELYQSWPVNHTCSDGNDVGSTLSSSLLANRNEELLFPRSITSNRPGRLGVGSWPRPQDTFLIIYILCIFYG